MHVCASDHQGALARLFTHPSDHMVGDHRCMLRSLRSLLSRQRDAVRDLEHADVHPASAGMPFSRQMREHSGTLRTSTPAHICTQLRHSLGDNSMQKASQPVRAAVSR